MSTKTQQHNDSGTTRIRKRVTRNPYLMTAVGSLFGALAFVALINGSVFPPNPVAGIGYMINHGMETLVFVGILMLTQGLFGIIGLYMAAKARQAQAR